MIYMKGIKHEILLAVVDFLYLGEANVFQESLHSFLYVAEELKLKGLMGQKEDAAKTEYTKQCSNPEQIKSNQPFHEGRKFDSNNGISEFSLTTKLEDHSQVVSIDNERRLSLPKGLAPFTYTVKL